MASSIPETTTPHQGRTKRTKSDSARVWFSGKPMSNPTMHASRASHVSHNGFKQALVRVMFLRFQSRSRNAEAAHHTGQREAVRCSMVSRLTCPRAKWVSVSWCPSTSRITTSSLVVIESGLGIGPEQSLVSDATRGPRCSRWPHHLVPACHRFGQGPRLAIQSDSCIDPVTAPCAHPAPVDVPLPRTPGFTIFLDDVEHLIGNLIQHHLYGMALQAALLPRAPPRPAEPDTLSARILCCPGAGVRFLHLLHQQSASCSSKIDIDFDSR